MSNATVQTMLTNVFVLVAIYYAVILSLRLIRFVFTKIQTVRQQLRDRHVREFAQFLADADYDRLYQRAKQLGLVTRRVNKNQICLLLAANILYPPSASCPLEGLSPESHSGVHTPRPIALS